MQIHWTCDGCDQHDEARIEQHWERVQIELEGKVAGLSDDPTELRFAVSRDDSPPEWTIHAALHLLGYTLVAESSAATPEEALDELLHELAGEIDRLEELPAPVKQRREGLEAMVPLLESSRSQNRSEAFFSFLVPLVESLGSYIQRELQIREREQTLVPEQVAPSDVLDEVLVEAWDRFSRRERNLPLDLWLIQLADQVMDRLSNSVVAESIDEETSSPSRENRQAVRDEWIEQATYPEIIELSELLPGQPGIATWDELDVETKQVRLSEMLGQLPWERRQAFVLHIAHGYDVAEIADFQDRAVQDVQADVASAVALIRRRFHDEGTPELEERYARAEMRERKRRHS